jgi:anti-sigma-K factor RskA
VGGMTHRCGLGPGDLGPLLLGGLPAAERRRVEERLATCPDCAAEVSALQPVVAAMAQAAPTVELDGRGQDDLVLQDGALERLLAAVDAERPGVRRRPARPWRLPAIAAAATVLVAALVTGGLTLLGRGGDGQQVTLSGPAGAHASARLDQRSWGTAVQLKAGGLKPGTAYGAWLAYPDGRRVGAGTFVAQSDGSAEVDLTAALSLEQSATLGVTALGGSDVMAVRLP